MQSRIKLIIATVVVVLFGIIVSVTLIKKFSPSNEVMPITELYSSAAEDLTIILNNRVSEEKGYYSDHMSYINYDTVKSLFNNRFYWALDEGVMIFTTPTEIIKFTPDDNNYISNKETVTSEYAIVKMVDNKPYLAIEYVAKYSDIKYSVYENPNRILITSDWDMNLLCAGVKKESSLRYEPDIKSPILVELAAGDEVTFIDQEEELKNGFSKVITVDGIIGYVKSNRLDDSEYKTLKSDYVGPEYTHITKDYNICMVWHQVTSQYANEGLLGLLNATKGVNTISPTWFAIAGNDGSVSSIASEKYVSRAHEAGVEVWGLCNDFSKDIDMAAIMKDTSVREKLAKKLISLAIEYDLDGLNIDFENIPKEAGEDYIQFIRELSVRCRNNNIVLSIDNYIPTEYRAYYDYSEQGNVADYVVVMAYDEHYNGCGESGSVSSISFVKEAAENIQSYVDPSRVIMALPFYTRLWKEKGDDITSEAYSMNNAMLHLNNRNVPYDWDEDTGQYYAQYKEEGATYKIWLEEERSIEEKLKAVTEAGLHNVVFWKMGLERTEVWNVISDYVR